MAKLDREEGLRTAEREAWAARGRNNSFWYTDGSRMVKPLAIAGAVIFAGYWLFRGIAAALEGIGSAEAPHLALSHSLVLWVTLPVLLIATVTMLRKIDRFRTLGPVVIGVALMLAAWVGWILLLLNSF